jgi:hypothetical protein
VNALLCCVKFSTCCILDSCIWLQLSWTCFTLELGGDLDLTPVKVKEWLEWLHLIWSWKNLSCKSISC